MPLNPRFEFADPAFDPWGDHPAWPKVEKAIRMLHYGTILILALTIFAYLAIFGDLGISLSGFLPGILKYAFLVYLTGLCLVSVVADAVVVRGLKQRRPWAWIAALVLFAMDAGSLLFLPMSIIGFIQLGDPEVRAAFDGLDRTSGSAGPQSTR